MKTIVAALITFMAGALVAGAPQERKTTGVAGSWELTVKGPAAHGDMTATMELQQDGRKVSGRLTAHGNTHPLAGEFNDGELSLHTTDTPDHHAITLTANLGDDGRLTGYLSGPMGDMQWTASKIKDKH
jgi:hypothetical protein